MAGLGEFLQDLYGDAPPLRKGAAASGAGINEALEAFTSAKEAVLRGEGSAAVAPAAPVASGLPEPAEKILAVLRIAGPQTISALIERSGLDTLSFLDAFGLLRVRGLVRVFKSSDEELCELTPDGLSIAQRTDPPS